MEEAQGSKIKKILYTLLLCPFFDEGKTLSDVIEKLDQKGFTIKGKKNGMIARMLTQMCQDPEAGLERNAIPKEKIKEKGKWMFKKSKS